MQNIAENFAPYVAIAKKMYDDHFGDFSKYYQKQIANEIKQVSDSGEGAEHWIRSLLTLWLKTYSEHNELDNEKDEIQSELDDLKREEDDSLEEIQRLESIVDETAEYPKFRSIHDRIEFEELVRAWKVKKGYYQ